MVTILLIFILILSLYALVKSADVFVDAMSNLASYLKIPTFVVALTIVAFGTSTPELAISFNSILAGNGVLTLSNVVGANIVNVLLVLGVASLVRPIKITNAVTKKQVPMLILITLVFATLFCDMFFDDQSYVNAITRNDGIVLILLFFVFAKYLYEIIRASRLSNDEYEKPRYSMFKTIVLGIIGLVMVLVTADAAVDASTMLAGIAGISDKIVGMVIIGIGTSLPELVTSIITAKKGDFDFTIGNIVGTNIFNICIVIGLPVLLLGNIDAYGFGIIDMGILALSTLILFFFSSSEKVITRLEGIIMLMIFALYYSYVIFC